MSRVMHVLVTFSNAASNTFLHIMSPLDLWTCILEYFFFQTHVPRGAVGINTFMSLIIINQHALLTMNVSPACCNFVD